ncbi:tRNA (adenosine(37)-N6)-dimethylallyltransferase MiaA [Sessilibacter corallicola]|uniref:tRNA dimethylallyltransferase n=1 Tax=Sessilibacter corallicola TaxID=2904075 RepID=A0ABQ0A5D2_9GAMM|nr:tRNA (adenosine(37)-N6)-dimethylallyltransferase MiaA [Sessilibacter corallicola]MCE2027629.1 tRNA (adenosine(37)-N6)-dimethylallyltransferase MiaA [Sessilibacter corallicola]
MGPTASGKTALALSLADYFPIEIISVDSALVYRELNIGSAKPTAEEMSRVPHHLIDVCDPSVPFSVADFCEQAEQAMRAITERGNIPVLVGGTMMYFRSFLDGLAQMPATNDDVRAYIESIALEKGWPEIHRRLAEVDPISAKEIHPNHSQRLSRALEVYLSSGKTMTELRENQAKHNEFLQNYQIAQFAIGANDRSLLHERIALRFQQMLELGFIEEIESLYQRGDLNENLPAIRAVGYRQFWNYCSGESSLEQAHEKAVIATRQLAKRQLTWLRGWKDPLYWLYIDDNDGNLIPSQQIIVKALKIIEQFAI